MKKEIQHSSSVTTPENLLGPIASNTSNQLWQAVTLCSWILFCCQLVGEPSKHLLDRPSCSWTITCALPQLTPSSKAKNLTVIVGSSTVNASVLSKELLVTDVRGLPAWASSSTLSLPSVKCCIYPSGNWAKRRWQVTINHHKLFMDKHCSTCS